MLNISPNNLKDLYYEGKLDDLLSAEKLKGKQITFAADAHLGHLLVDGCMYISSPHHGFWREVLPHLKEVVEDAQSYAAIAEAVGTANQLLDYEPVVAAP